MISNFSKRALYGAGLLASVFASPVLAQDQPPDTSEQTNEQTTPETRPTAQIEQITVTARRREEDVQKVPLAISAITGESLSQHGIQNGQDLSKLVPALTTNQSSRDEEGYALRGLTNSGANFEGLQNNVAPYFSQVPYPTNDGGGPGRYFDLGNVQVLKGPQGTLFGRNSTGGAILFEPNRPTNEYDGEASVQYGNYNDQVYEGMLNIPINDQLMIRFAGKREERDGFTTNIVNGEKLDGRDYWSERVGVEWRPNQQFDNYFVFDSSYSDTSGSSEEFLAGNPNFVLDTVTNAAGGCVLKLTFGGPIPTPGCASPTSLSVYTTQQLLAAAALQRSLGPREVASDIDSIDKTWSWGFTDIAAYSLDADTTLKNIFGYRELKKLQRLDDDGSTLPVLEGVSPGGWNEDTAQYTDEINFHTKMLNNKLDITAGNFFLFSHPAGIQQTFTEQLGPLPPAGLIGSVVDQTVHGDEFSEALYGEAVYNLGDIDQMLKDFRFTAGYRYTWDRRTLQEFAPRLGNPINPCDIGTPAQQCSFDLDADFHSPSWNFGLDWQLDPDTLLYVTARRGYRSGGLNVTVAEASQVEFKPEIVKDWEIGIKNDWKWEGMKGRSDVALYHDDIQDVQVNQAFVGQNGSFIALINNSATASVNGIEVDETVVPIPDLQITAAWDYTKAQYDTYTLVSDGGLGGIPLNGAEQFPFVPLNRWSLDIRYFLPVPETLGDVSVDATEHYVGHTILSPSVDPFGMSPAFTTLDLHLDWNQVGGKPIDVSLYATNVYNSTYRIGGFPIYNTIGYSAELYGEPQMFGVKVKYRWGASAQ